MASIETGGDGGKKGKPKQQQLRVDFTPMVDMNMLLITFFMFCTTMSKPQTMELVLPTKDTKDMTEEEKNKVKDSKAITVILGENDKVYYYFGKPDYDDYTSLKETDFSPEGIRKVLVERNIENVRKMQELRKKKYAKQISNEDFDKEAKEIRASKDGQVVLIKPTDGSTFRNLVDILDEMAICSIGVYAIVEMTDGDNFLVENLQKSGALTQQAAAVKH
ncbi:biopolymer transporter ExbD [Parabacteroides sp. Marseille-P3160]|uniref:ExbD/TolR family protein n=1 Tax=Parabacteroides sp. Marseille-P3160 TaxID=1917887 RepID=UPI0009BC36D1|nr:biopolymer transporter ExbD [Parabacteroides sp. Marseille-P3160]